MTPQDHAKVLRVMFAECANDRRMQEADALAAALAALDAALQAPGAEPVAYRWGACLLFTRETSAKQRAEGTPLYAAPPTGASAQEEGVDG